MSYTAVPVPLPGADGWMNAPKILWKRLRLSCWAGAAAGTEEIVRWSLVSPEAGPAISAPGSTVGVLRSAAGAEATSTGGAAWLSVRPTGRRGGSGTASGVTSSGDRDATLEVDAGTLTIVAPPTAAVANVGATRDVAVSRGSNAILGATDESGALS